MSNRYKFRSRSYAFYCCRPHPYLPGSMSMSFTGWLRKEPVEVITSELTGCHSQPLQRSLQKASSRPRRNPVAKEDLSGSGQVTLLTLRRKEVPVAVIRRIFYRHDPIILGVPALRPPITTRHIPWRRSCMGPT